MPASSTRPDSRLSRWQGGCWTSWPLVACGRKVRSSRYARTAVGRHTQEAGARFVFPGTEGHGSSTARHARGTSEGMTESFAQLFEESLANQRIRPGMILTGLIVDVTSDVVIVNVGLKSEAVIPLEQFKNERGEVEVKAGD